MTDLQFVLRLKAKAICMTGTISQVRSVRASTGSPCTVTSIWQNEKYYRFIKIVKMGILDIKMNNNKFNLNIMMYMYRNFTSQKILKFYSSNFGDVYFHQYLS